MRTIPNAVGSVTLDVARVTWRAMSEETKKRSSDGANNKDSQLFGCVVHGVVHHHVVSTQPFSIHYSTHVNTEVLRSMRVQLGVGLGLAH